HVPRDHESIGLAHPRFRVDRVEDIRGGALPSFGYFGGIGKGALRKRGQTGAESDQPRTDPHLRAHQAQTLLAAIVDSSDDAIISKSVEGRILSWNAGAERLFGWSAREAIGQFILLVIPPERASEEREILARIRAGERIGH